MSDRLERDLARELAPVAAPEALGVRLGLAPARRREAPAAQLAVAAAVLLAIAGGYSAGRVSGFQSPPAAARGARSGEAVELASHDPAVVAAAFWRREAALPVRVTRCPVEPSPAAILRVKAGKAAVLVAHAAPAAEFAAANEGDAGCRLCHAL